MTSRSIHFTDDELRKAVDLSRSIAETIRTLGLTVSGYSHKLTRKRIDALQVDISHFDFNHKDNSKIDIVDILVENSTYTNIRYRVLKEELLAYICVECGLTKWNGKPLSLELDHINGVNTDNRIQNLRWLCPNCHSQTETFGGRNQTKKEKFVKRIEQKVKMSVIEWPSDEELLDRLNGTAYTKLAKELGVSDNSIRKRLGDKAPKRYKFKDKPL